MKVTEDPKTIYLFSYGTLQKKRVQLESFRRILVGRKDILKGYKITYLEIKDKKVLSSSRQKYHPIAIPSNDLNAAVEGMVFEISKEELLVADQYEVEDYKRIEVTLESGQRAWIYVATK